MLPSLSTTHYRDNADSGLAYLAPYGLNSDVRILCHVRDGVCVEATLHVDNWTTCYWLSVKPQTVQ